MARAATGCSIVQDPSDEPNGLSKRCRRDGGCVYTVDAVPAKPSHMGHLYKSCARSPFHSCMDMHVTCMNLTSIFDTDYHLGHEICVSLRSRQVVMEGGPVRPSNPNENYCEALIEHQSRVCYNSIVSWCTHCLLEPLAWPACG